MTWRWDDWTDVPPVDVRSLRQFFGVIVKELLP